MYCNSLLIRGTPSNHHAPSPHIPTTPITKPKPHRPVLTCSTTWLFSTALLTTSPLMSSSSSDELLCPTMTPDSPRRSFAFKDRSGDEPLRDVPETRAAIRSTTFGVAPSPHANAVQIRYGCLLRRGERMYATDNALMERMERKRWTARP